ncbi:hypothetical protein FPZ49_14210 [Paenibacillus cremeus]|uniref:Uncharacterized protein n=2 Tax=Paenibacillus cremeus TaxID=2163881 RepID=A0A559KB31_9BACL|nr:hypothetical protein FPZ49_14210 [Paenibacillus cremeus]
MSIRQPQPDIEMTTTPTKIELNSPKGELKIDQDAAWDALGVSRRETFNARMASEGRRIAMEAIERIAEKGNRLARIQDHADVIADFAAEDAFTGNGVNYLGDPSYNNVDIDYIPHKVETEVTPGSVDYRATPHYAEVNYQPGKVSFYMQQYPKVEMIPPQIDLKV